MVKVGWIVRVIAGKDSGKEGEVLRVLKKSGKVVVKGVSIQVKNVKKTQEKPGEVVRFEAPIDASNVMLIDSNGGVTRVGVKKSSDGKNVYVEKTTGKEIKENFKK
jgi:large subunit ribosomal protein L24